MHGVLILQIVVRQVFHEIYTFGLLPRSAMQRLNQIPCHGFHEFARIFLNKSKKICEIHGDKTLSQELYSYCILFPGMLVYVTCTR